MKSGDVRPLPTVLGAPAPGQTFEQFEGQRAAHEAKSRYEVAESFRLAFHDGGGRISVKPSFWTGHYGEISIARAAAPKASWMTLWTDSNLDGLYRADGTMVLPPREFSLHKYGPLDTPQQRKQAREYVRRALARLAAEKREWVVRHCEGGSYLGDDGWTQAPALARTFAARDQAVQAMKDHEAYYSVPSGTLFVDAL